MFSIIGTSGNRIEFSEFKNVKVLYDGYWVSRDFPSSKAIQGELSSFEDNSLIRLKTHCYTTTSMDSRNIYIKNESINKKPILFIEAGAYFYNNGYRILDFCNIDVKIYHLSPRDLKNKYTKVDYVEFIVKSNYIVKTKVKLLK